MTSKGRWRGGVGKMSRILDKLMYCKLVKAGGRQGGGGKKSSNLVYVVNNCPLIQFMFLGQYVAFVDQK